VNPTLDDVFGRSERMVGRRLGHEYVLVPIVGRGVDVDSIFNLNRLGTFIWEHLDGRSSGRAIVSAIVEHFCVAETEATADYLGFIEQLHTIHALVEGGGPEAA
jgi:hypothetical protein